MKTLHPRANHLQHAPLTRLLVLAALALGAIAVSACSTTEGFGEDVKNLGGSIENSAEKNK